MSGHKPFSRLTEALTASEEGRQRVEEYRRLMDAVLTLYALRAERGLTQVEVAEALDVTQGNVSRVERSADVYVSTLSRYVQALGGHLELTAVFPDQVVSLTLPDNGRAA
jgi:DNA-binding XRE family transcriptional regulator